MSETATAIIDPLNPITQEFLDDPYPIYDKIRNAAPLCWSKKGKYWLVTSYELAQEITKDLRFEKHLERTNNINPLFKMLPGPSYMSKTRSNWMINQNPPDHTKMRSLVNKAFSPKMIQQMYEHIQAIADRLIDEAMPKGKIEFVSEFAFLLPITVIAEMLGIPAKDHASFKDWSHKITQTLEPGYGLDTLKVANDAYDQLVDYLKPLVAERRENPKEDLISALVHAEIDGEKLSELDVLGNICLILVAGHETTVNLIGNGMLALLQNPDQLELLKANPDLIASATEEFLRYDSPVQSVRRLVGEDMEFHGQKMHKHDMVVIFLGACNRDPKEFEDPNKLDINRKNIKHISFSSGIHHCLGAALARMEGQIAIGTILRRLPNIRLAEQTLVHKRPYSLRGVQEMHLLF